MSNVQSVTINDYRDPAKRTIDEFELPYELHSGARLVHLAVNESTVHFVYGLNRERPDAVYHATHMDRDRVLLLATGAHLADVNAAILRDVELRHGLWG